MNAEKKIRVDQLLVERGLAESRQRAQAMIMAGNVLADGRPVTKAGQQVSKQIQFTVKESCPYVSRGGLKLEGALNAFDIDVQDKICLDVGASTGGFTDCLLQHGAEKVYAVDVGYGQLAWKLRQDERVVAIERANIRYLPAEKLPHQFDIITIDTSFISLKIVIPAIIKFLKPNGLIVALIKPQFEIGKGRVGKGGVVRDPEDHQEVLDDLAAFAGQQGLACRTAVTSPINGPKGNVEFFNVFSLDFHKNAG